MMSRACPLLLVLLCAATAGAGPQAKPPVPLRPIAPLDLGHALDLYAGGHIDEAVKMVAQAGDEVGRHLRRHWMVTGRQWIDADPAERSKRLLAAAALALETERLRAERGDWGVTDDPPCAATCVLDWAQLLLVERGAPDQAERAWYLAAAALAGGVRDWRYLQRAGIPAQTGRVPPGLMNRALLRFPDDPVLRLEEAMAAAARFNITTDGGRSPTGRVITLGPGRGTFTLGELRVSGAQTAAGMLAALADDPLVGAEARVRLGYLYWNQGNDEAARTELSKAAARAGDADLRYLAQFLLGWTALSRGDSVAAIPALEAALAARPASQSAALALAALELQRGDAAKADEIARTSLDERRADADPWRLFLYGHHPRWAALVADLRRQVKP